MWPQIRRGLQSLAMVFGIAVIVYCVVIALSTPGCETTINQPLGPDPIPKPLPAPPDPLRAAWDSESKADWAIAELLASVSDGAYLAPADAQEAFGKLGFANVTPIVIGSMIGYVASDEDATVIAFRGTNPTEIADWFVNLDNLSTTTAHGPMHRGFYGAYQLLRPQLHKLLAQSKPRHLWVTGHSLGGALALACAYDLAEDKEFPLDGVITFGQPLVARPPLAGYLDTLLLGRFAHYVNEADIVPRVPPGYTPCGSLVWFRNGEIRRSVPKRRVYGATKPGDASLQGEAEIVPVTDEEFQAKKRELQAQKSAPMTTPDGRPIYQGNTPFIRDHSMQLYLEKIREVHQKQLEPSPKRS